MTTSYRFVQKTRRAMDLREQLQRPCSIFVGPDAFFELLRLAGLESKFEPERPWVMIGMHELFLVEDMANGAWRVESRDPDEVPYIDCR